MEQNNKINFLNFILTRTNDTFQTTAYRKRNRNGVYGTLARRMWKRGTLRTIFIRVYKFCSTKELLHNELKQVEEFIKINGFPKWVFDQVNE